MKVRLVIALVVVGCSSSGLQHVEGPLVVEPSSLQFNPTFLGYPSQGTLTLRNGSATSREVQLAFEGPFQGPAQLTVSGSSNRPLDIVFAPVQVGSSFGVAHLSWQGGHQDVSLSGVGRSIPDCEPDACHRSAFDPKVGACISAPLADGTDCSAQALCLEAPTCMDGLCVGPARSCDDGQLCTGCRRHPDVGSRFFEGVAGFGVSSTTFARTWTSQW